MSFPNFSRTFATPKTINPGIRQLTISPDDSLRKVSAAAKPFVFASTHVLGKMAVRQSIKETLTIGFTLHCCKTHVTPLISEFAPPDRIS